MIISNKYKLIFIHIYKNAGTAITQWIQTIDKKAIRYQPNHITALKAKKSLQDDKILSKKWEKYVKFAVVRNSWDWQVSLYYYVLKSPKHPQYELIKNMKSFKEYIIWRCNYDKHYQKDFVCDENGVSMVNEILRFDNLENDFKCFMLKKKRINEKILNQHPLRTINVSKHNHYSKYYCDETKNLIENHFEKDIKYFGFSFDNTISDK